MRALTAIAGIVLGGPTLLFFWIGAQTFIRPHERMLAVALTFEAGALLALSVVLMFTPSVQRLQAALLGATILSLVILFGIYRPSK